MIPKSAVKKFLNRPRDDHRWMKRFSGKQLDKMLAEINPCPRLSTKLRVHQKVCVYLGIAFPSFAFWLDMGTGKSLVALELLRYWWDCGRLRRALIFVRSDKAFASWANQLVEWRIDLPTLFLDVETSAAKWRLLDKFDEGLIFVAYPSAVAMTHSAGKNSKKWTIDNKLMRRLGKKLDALVLDESTACGNYDSLTTTLCRRLRRRSKICYALAGRPFGRDPTLLWSQHDIIDAGETLGETLGLFRAAFYDEEENAYDPRGYAKNYTFKKKMKAQLMRAVQHRSIAYAADECIELPRRNSVIEAVKLPEEAGAYQRKVIQQIIDAKGNLKAMENAFLRMRQLSSGFLGFRHTEDESKIEIAFDQNPKMDRLFDLLAGLPDDRKAVIFYEFTFSGRRIVERLKEVGLKGIWLWSGTKDAAAKQRRFQERDDCRVAVLNNRVGAYSLDGLQRVSNYAFFYESPLSPIDREQAERRLLRDGQKWPVFITDLVTEGTGDRIILQHHREGDSLLAELRKNPYLLTKGS